MTSTPNQGGPIVIHFGPVLSHVGGIGSVMRVLRDHGVGREVRTEPTWVPGGHLAVLKAATRAATVILRTPRGAVAHFHVSQRGSFVRDGLLIRLARLRGLTPIVTVHGSQFVDFARAHPAVVRLSLAPASAITCLTTEARDVIRAIVPAAFVTVIPNPVAVPPVLEGAATTDELVLFAGEVGVRKGVDVLIEAWPIVRGERPNARCLLVGPGTEFDVPQLPGLSVQGPVSNDDVHRLLQQARVVVLPSRAEAMPMILLEALAAARPFVATPVGSVPELATGGSRIVPIADAPALAGELLAFLRDPQLAEEVGTRGRTWCLQSRSSQAVAASLEEIYTQAGAA